MGKNYIVMHAKLKCDKGCIENYLNCGTDHGVYKTLEDGSKYPVMNASDMKVGINISQFGKCSVTNNKCVPAIVTPWYNANEANTLENGAILTEASKLVCTLGGIISIVLEE